MKKPDDHSHIYCLKSDHDRLKAIAKKHNTTLKKLIHKISKKIDFIESHYEEILRKEGK